MQKNRELKIKTASVIKYKGNLIDNNIITKTHFIDLTAMKLKEMDNDKYTS